jgi:hypothetical protein
VGYFSAIDTAKSLVKGSNFLFMDSRIQKNYKKNNRIRARFLRSGNLLRKFPDRKKPGFPLQVLGFAYANPVGFPLQSSGARPAAKKKKITTNCLKTYLAPFWVAHHKMCRYLVKRKNVPGTTS